MARVTVYEAEIMARDNMRALKEEYTRMRDIAQKRIKRLGESSFKESKAYVNNQTGFAKLKDLDIRDLPKAFSELSKFVSAKGSSVTGQKQIRAKTIKTLQEQGLGVNDKNYGKVIKIFEEMRKQKLTYGSDKVVELADSMLYLDDQQTNQWLDHLDTLLQNTDKLQEIPEVEGYDFDEVLEMLGE